MLCDIFNEIKYSDLISSAALVVSGASFLISLYKNRCTFDIIVRDLYRDNDTSNMEIDIINRSSLPIVVQDIYIEQGKNSFRADHTSHKLIGPHTFNGKHGLAYKSIDTRGLPLTVNGYDSESGVFAFFPSSAGPFDGTARFCVYTNRGKRKVRKFIEDSGSIRIQLMANR